MLDEAVERPLGFGWCDGEEPRAVVADRVRQVHPVEVVSDLFVDVVFARLVGLRNLQRRLLFRGRLAVVLVVVPAVADGSVAVHQHVEPAALIAVEVLHAESGAITRPLGEVLAGQREGGRRQDVGDEALLAEAVHEPFGGV